MPIVLSNLDPNSGEIKVRFLEPYVTEGLNAKFVGLVPRGTFRGFRLDTNVGALTVTVTADATANDHSAHYITADGHGLRIRRTGGNFALNLSGEAGNTVLICIYATYSVGVATAGDIRAYTLAEFAALASSLQKELVILGQVVVPASGVIPSANITHSQRSWAYQFAPQDALPWLSLLNDPGFELMPALSAVRTYTGVWSLDEVYTRGSYSIVTNAPSGEKSLLYSQTSSAGISLPQVKQLVMVPVQAGQTIRVRLDFQSLAVSTSGMIIQPIFLNAAGSSVAGAGTYTLSNVVDSAYTAIDISFRAPPTAVVLQTVLLGCAGGQWPVGPAWRLNNFQVFLENIGTGNNNRGSVRGLSNALVQTITFASGVPSTDAPVLNLSGNSVRIDRSDNTYDSGHAPPAVISSGLVVAGESLSDQSTARLFTPYALSPSTGYTLLWANTYNPTDNTFRVYVGPTGTFDRGFYLVFGAYWDVPTNKWVPNSTCYRLAVNANGMSIQASPNNTGTAFNDNQWRILHQTQASIYSSTPQSQYMNAFYDMITNAVEAAKSRVHYETAVGARTLIFDTGPIAGKRVRVYHNTIGASGFNALNPEVPSTFTFAWEVVTNATWDPSIGGGSWVPDSTSTNEFITKLIITDSDIFWGFNTNQTNVTDASFQHYSLARYGAVKAWGTAVADYSLKRAFSDFTWPYYWVAAGYNIKASDVLTSPARLRISFQYPVLTVPNIYGETGGNRDQYCVVASSNIPDLSGTALGTSRTNPVLITNKTILGFDIVLFSAVSPTTTIDPTTSTYTGSTALYQSFVVFGNSRGQ